MLGISAVRICTRSGGDGLDTLPLAVTEDALRVESKGFTPALSDQDPSDAVEVLRQPPRRGSIHQIRHSPFDHACDECAISPTRNFTNDRNPSGFSGE